MNESDTTQPNAAAQENPGAAPLELPSRYDPHLIEERWAARWVAEPFTADPHSPRPPFTIVIPPANITGDLHLGHAFDNTIIDTLIRFKRMQGFEALFQPGTDHAGIATQVLVERELRSEGVSRVEMGREEFIERVWSWEQRFGDIILQQLQRLGVSADWPRTRFTLDEGLSEAVRRQFVTLYHQGLIYRGERIVNWDPASRTTLSELEVEREERPGKLFTLAYELEDGSAISIATVRPETIFADVAIAVHPSDRRFAELIGKQARIPLTDRWIPVIADEAVEIDFGTGALKITPAHDPTDFEIGERHGLPRPSVIGLDAKLAGELVPQEFRGLDRFAAREPVVAALEADGSLLGVADHTISLGLSERTGEPVEPILSLQWFYDTGSAAASALAGLDAGEMKIHPERYEKVNRDWLGKLRPWNISRQLWWGHRIPAWYDAAGNIYVPDPENPQLDPPDDPRYAGIELTQDPDVFDTWFSSNLWPFSTLGWPDVDDPFYRKFYPTSVLVTGYDILFFWVARMQIAGYQFTEQAPFHDVLQHGLVLDAQGQKMSKSKGNGVDPLELIAQTGADALRFALTRASTGGQDIRWDERRVEMGRNFANKLWNATRFALMNLQGAEEPATGGPAAEAAGSGTVPKGTTLADRWILSRLKHALTDITRHLEAFDLGLANRVAYEFVWSEFCDWYLEAAKPELRAGSAATRSVLRFAVEQVLALLHPFMPFITSELWQALGHSQQLGLSRWPDAGVLQHDEAAEREFALLQDAVAAVRNLRTEAGLSPGQLVPVAVSGAASGVISANAEVFASLARAELLAAVPAGTGLTQQLPELELRLPLEGLVDVAQWRARQEKKLAELEADAAKASRKLTNAGFIAKAPAEVVQEEERKLREARELAERLRESLGRLG
jgi:valyl-tRNA synthetase